jgi:hypothetical protein
MPELQLHNRPIETILPAAREKENDITYSVGWALYRSPAFLRKFLEATVGEPEKGIAAVIRLQDYRKESGITDIEIEAPGHYHLHCGMQVRPELPRIYQLEKYDPRLKKHESKACKIIAMSECNSDYASRRLSISKIKKIPRANGLLERNRGNTKECHEAREIPRKKHLLKDLLTYLGLSGQVKSGQRWSGQNRPTDVAGT